MQRTSHCLSAETHVVPMTSTTKHNGSRDAVEEHTDDAVCRVEIVEIAY